MWAHEPLPAAELVIQRMIIHRLELVQMNISQNISLMIVKAIAFSCTMREMTDIFFIFFLSLLRRNREKVALFHVEVCY